MVIYVPEIGESTSQVIDTDQQSMVVNINTADQSTLESLPGVGPATAQNIIAYRTEVGPFETIEDIMNVNGIGEETFANLSAYIMV
jgi:competence protein ComEA